MALIETRNGPSLPGDFQKIYPPIPKPDRKIVVIKQPKYPVKK